MTDEQTEAQLIVMVEVCRQRLTPIERTLVQRAAREQVDRFYGLLSLRGGESMTPDQFARFMLQCARQALVPGGAS